MTSKGKQKFSERTLVLLKPDVVQRGIVGEILSRFEKKGLKIVGLRMVWPSRDMALRHYTWPETAMIALGERTIAAYKDKGIEDKRSPREIALDIQKKLVNYLCAGPLVALVIEGAHAVAYLRKMRGAVNTLNADLGSITADYTIDSYFISDEDDRAARTLVHASGSVEEANEEIPIWFEKEDLYDYNLAIEEILYAKDWESHHNRTTKSDL
jgi:nucleoside-diphosphate kinase